jgi:hypothetical protein
MCRSVSDERHDARRAGRRSFDPRDSTVRPVLRLLSGRSANQNRRPTNTVKHTMASALISTCHPLPSPEQVVDRLTDASLVPLD